MLLSIEIVLLLSSCDGGEKGSWDIVTLSFLLFIGTISNV